MANPSTASIGGKSYPIIDHSFDVVVVGAGGAGLRARPDAEALFAAFCWGWVAAGAANIVIALLQVMQSLQQRLERTCWQRFRRTLHFVLLKRIQAAALVNLLRLV